MCSSSSTHWSSFTGEGGSSRSTWWAVFSEEVEDTDLRDPSLELSDTPWEVSSTHLLAPALRGGEQEVHQVHALLDTAHNHVVVLCLI